MSILDNIKDKAQKLLSGNEKYVTRQTNVYNAAMNKIIVAGIPLDGVVSSSINANVITKQETGIDYYYTAIYDFVEQRTLTVTVLPTAACQPILRELALAQMYSKGWFNISVHENSKIVDVFRGWVIEMPEISMQQETENKQYTFGIKTMHSGSIAVIDRDSETETAIYNKYGSRPDRFDSNKSTTINEENSNDMFTYPHGRKDGGSLSDVPHINLPDYDDGSYQDVPSITDDGS